MSRKRAATRSRLKPQPEASEASSSESLKSVKTEEDRIDLSDFMLQSPTKARAPQTVTLKVRSRGLILVSFCYKQEICDKLKEFEIDGKRACFWHTQEKRWSYASTTHVDVCAHGNMLCNWSRNHYGYSDTTELKLAAAPDVFLARMYSFLNACPHVEDIIIEDINKRTALHSDMGSLTFPGFQDIQLHAPPAGGRLSLYMRILIRNLSGACGKRELIRALAECGSQSAEALINFGTAETGQTGALPGSFRSRRARLTTGLPADSYFLGLGRRA